MSLSIDLAILACLVIYIALSREENSLSREIQATFKSNARRLESRHLLLNRTDGLNRYDRLSDGEKVLALHKTFNHLRKVTEVNLLLLLLSTIYYLLLYGFSS